jgi:hypothetical protein
MLSLQRRQNENNPDPRLRRGEATREKIQNVGFTYKQVVNEALRAGLSVAEKARRPYVPVSFSIGGSLVNLTKANSLAAELEDQDTLAKHAKLNTTLGKKTRNVKSNDFPGRQYSDLCNRSR